MTKAKKNDKVILYLLIGAIAIAAIYFLVLPLMKGGGGVGQNDYPAQGQIAYLSFDAEKSDVLLGGGAVLANGALVLDGVDDHATFQDITLSKTAGSFAFYIEPNGEQHDKKIFGDKSISAHKFIMIIKNSDPKNNNAPVFRFLVEGDINNDIAKVVIPTTVTGHYTMVWKDGNVKFYRNGVIMDTSSSWADAKMDGDLTINTVGMGAYGYFFKGKIDEVIAYNRALNDGEVLQLYNAYKNK